MGRAIVIGAGVVGASVAYHLATAGMEVQVHDSGRPGGGTSGASLAWTNAVDRTPEHYFRLSHLAMAAHRSLQIEVGRTWQHGTGMIEFAEDDQGRQILEDRMQRLRTWGYPVQRLTTEQVSRVVEPELTLDPGRVPWVAAFPDDRFVQATVMIGALLGAACRAGASVHPNSPVTGVRRAGGRVTGVNLGSGDEIDAEVVINCAGPWAAEVGTWFGLDLPMHRRPGLILVTQPAPTEIRGVIRAPGLELREDGGGRVLLNALFAEDRLDLDVAPSIDAPVSREALTRARGLLRGLDGVEFEVSRLGQRPMPDDGRPLVGPVPGLDGAYVVVTHSGVSLSALLGRMVADEIARDTIQPELEELRLDRVIERPA
jgi:glycine/D-amino acid oxidase-like deaminating enzyme